uniref:protein-tyrosine-phosphatase n=1 Tax=Podarcis muralis TaxID=64176 RepID=A0A670IA00_PODMU
RGGELPSSSSSQPGFCSGCSGAMECSIFLGQALLPRDCSWSRLKVHVQGPLEEERLSLQQPCFWDINRCLEASLEKRKRVLIHCRDGYSLAPTCVIQYLMVKHHMRLLAAYDFVRARYPVNIQECHQDLLVDLERSLWPGEVDMECSKQAMSRKMAWT